MTLEARSEAGIHGNFNENTVYHWVSDFAKGGLEAIQSSFSRDMDISSFRRPQEGGICTLDVLLLYGKEALKLDKDFYQTLRGDAQEIVLKEYESYAFDYMQGALPQDVERRFSILRFLEETADTLRRETLRTTEKRAYDPVKMAMRIQYLDVLHKKIEETKASYHALLAAGLYHLEPLSIGKNDTLLSLAPLEELSEDLPIFEEDFINSQMHPSCIWPDHAAGAQPLIAFLKEWSKFCFAEGGMYICLVAKSMPSVNNPYWDLSGLKQEECNQVIDEIAGLGVMAIATVSNYKIHPNIPFHLEKILAILHRLSDKHSQVGKDMHVDLVWLQQIREVLKGILFTTDGTMDREIIETRAFLDAYQERTKGGNPLFADLTCSDMSYANFNPEKISITEEAIDRINEEGESNQTEIARVWRYYLAHQKEYTSQINNLERIGWVHAPATKAAILASCFFLEHKISIPGYSQIRKYLLKLRSNWKTLCNLNHPIARIRENEKMCVVQYEEVGDNWNIKPFLFYDNGMEGVDTVPSKPSLLREDPGEETKKALQQRRTVFFTLLSSRTISEREVMEVEESTLYHIAALVCAKESKLQIIKALEFFSNHIDLLQKEYYRNMLMGLFLEPGILMQTLDPDDPLAPQVALALAEFVTRGFHLFIAREETVKEACFFAKLANCLDFHVRSAFAGSPFLQEWPEISFFDDLLSYLDKQENIKTKLTIAYEIMSVYADAPIFPIEQLDKIFRCMCLIERYPGGEIKEKKSYSFFSGCPSYIENGTYRTVCLGFIMVADLFYKMKEAKQTGVLDAVLDKTFGITGSPWNYDRLPVVLHEAKGYAFDLTTGNFYCAGQEVQYTISKKIRNSYDFQRLFPSLGQLENIFEEEIKGRTYCVFRNKASNTNFRITENKAGEIIFFRETSDGSWLRLYKKPLPEGIARTVCKEAMPWYNPKEQSIDFINQANELTYIYSFVTSELESPNEEVAINMEADNALYRHIKKFDPAAQGFLDKKTGSGWIELPTYNIKFTFDSAGKIQGTGGLSGMRLSDNQYVTSLAGINPYLVLKDESTKMRIVLLPSLEPTPSGELTEILSLVPPVALHEQVQYRKFEVTKGKAERLFSAELADRLYLARVYQTRNQFTEAYRLLDTFAGKQEAFDNEELDLLFAIIQFTPAMAEKDPNVKLLSLKAAALVVNNAARYGMERGEEWERIVGPNPKTGEHKFKQIYLEYIRSITRVKQTLKLRKEEDRMICSLVGLSEKTGESFSRAVIDKNSWRKNLFKGACDLSAEFFNAMPIVPEKWLPIDGPIQLNLTEMRQVFLPLYAIARSRDPQHLALREKVRSRLHHMIGANKDEVAKAAHFLLGILECSEAAIRQFPTSEQFIGVIAQIQNKLLLPYTVDGLLKQYGEISYRSLEVLEGSRLISQKPPTARIQGKKPEYARARKEPIAPIPFVKIPPTNIDYGAPVGLIPSETEILDDPQILQQLKQKLLADIESSSTVTSPKKKGLIELANKPPEVGINQHQLKLQLEEIPEITWQHLQVLYAKGNLETYRQLNPALTNEDVLRLYQQTEELLLEGAVQQQRRRGVDLLEKIEAAAPEFHPELLEKLHVELKAKREYSVHEHPELLIYEYKCNIRLRQSQVLNIEKLMKQDKNSLIELIMGSGKTDVLLPLVALKMADGYHLFTLILPKELIRTNGATLEVRMGNLYQKMPNRLNWKDVSLRGLEQLYGDLQKIIVQREFLLVTPEELHHFFLEEQVLRGAYAKSFSLADKKKLEKFLEIRHLLKERGHAIIDEVDGALRCDFEVHKAIGNPAKVEANYRTISMALYKLLWTDKTIAKTIHFEFARTHNGAEPYNEKDDKSFIIGILARKLLRSKEFHSLGFNLNEKELEQVKRYLLTSKEEILPESLNKEAKDTLAYAHNQLHEVMPLTLKKVYGVNYGLVDENPVTRDTLLPIPHRGAQCPQYESQFASYDEQINCTIEAYTKTGIPPKLLEKQIEGMKADFIRQLGRRRGTRKRSLLEAYERLVGKENAQTYPIQSLQPQDYVAMSRNISDNPKLFHRFIGRYILPEIEHYPLYISSNAQILPRMFGHVHGVSGTVSQSKDAFAKIFAIELDPHIEKITEECLERVEEPIIAQTKEGDYANPVTYQEALLQELLEVQIGVIPRAMQDVGAWFKDIPPSKIAQMILSWGGVKNPPINSVVYFQGNKEMILKKDGKPEEFRKNAEEASDRFIYYPQDKCVGVDKKLPPDATSILTVSQNTKSREVMQGAWRMRRLPYGQRVTLAVTSELAGMINGDALSPLSTRKVIEYTKALQKEQQLTHNKKATMQEIKEHFMGLCRDTLDQLLPLANSDENHKNAYYELNELTINKIQDDPYEPWIPEHS